MQKWSGIVAVLVFLSAAFSLQPEIKSHPSGLLVPLGFAVAAILLLALCYVSVQWLYHRLRSIFGSRKVRDSAYLQRR